MTDELTAAIARQIAEEEGFTTRGDKFDLIISHLSTGAITIIIRCDWFDNGISKSSFRTFLKHAKGEYD